MAGEIVTRFDAEKLEQYKSWICGDYRPSEAEWAAFGEVVYATGLNPIRRQIYLTPQGIISGIDGLRLVANRTGCYAPGRPSEYTYDSEGNLVCARVYVKKKTSDGVWHEFCEEAFWAEYGEPVVRNLEEKRRQGRYMKEQPWEKMPHVMLAKCAESRALRRAFPEELSGVYSKEEIDQGGDESYRAKIEDELGPIREQVIEIAMRNGVDVGPFVASLKKKGQWDKKSSLDKLVEVMLFKEKEKVSKPTSELDDLIKKIDSYYKSRAARSIGLEYAGFGGVSLEDLETAKECWEAVQKTDPETGHLNDS